MCVKNSKWSPGLPWGQRMLLLAVVVLGATGAVGTGLAQESSATAPSGSEESQTAFDKFSTTETEAPTGIQTPLIEVAVSGTGPREVREAEQIALRVFLLNHYRDPALLGRSEVRALFSRASELAIRSELRTPQPEETFGSDTPRTRKVSSSGQLTHLLQVSFDQQAIQQSLSQTDAPVEESPPDEIVEAPASALVWMLVSDGRRTHVVADATGQNIQSRLREIAGGYGLKLDFPTGASQSVSAEQVVAADAATLRAMSARYGQSQLLRGQVQRNLNGQWSAQWTRQFATVEDQHAEQLGTLDQVLQSGMKWFASLVAGSPLDNGAQTINLSAGRPGILWVNQLLRPADYSRVVDALADTDGIDTVYVDRVNRAGLSFAILPPSSVHLAADTLRRLGWVQNSADVAGNPDADVIVDYVH